MRVAILCLLFSIAISLETASAQDKEGCSYTPSGQLVCRWTGGNVVRTTHPAPPPPGGPYLRTGADPIVGPCWDWTSRPPGIDSSDRRNERLIVAILGSRPPCEGEALLAQAWEVFRRFPLAGPLIRLQPPTGITGLPTYLSVDRPAPVVWSGLLPSGATAQVEATIARVEVAWGDETTEVYSLEALRPYPEGTATHLYRLKTCSPHYRTSHPSGPNCHPSLTAYPIRVTFSWFGRFRSGGPWIGLGILERTAAVDYDVDEVVGVLEDD